MRRSELVSLALAIVIPLGCGGSDNSSVTNPSISCPAATNGTFSATMNGQAWTACTKISVQVQKTPAGKDTVNTVSLAGTGFPTANVAYAVVMSASKTGAITPGSYPIAPTTGSNIVIGGSDGNGWGANALSGSGTITITAYSANHITGTFSFSAPRVTGTTGAATLSITNGVFDVSF